MPERDGSCADQAAPRHHLGTRQPGCSCAQDHPVPGPPAGAGDLLLRPRLRLEPIGHPMRRCSPITLASYRDAQGTVRTMGSRGWHRQRWIGTSGRPGRGLRRRRLIGTSGRADRGRRRRSDSGRDGGPRLGRGCAQQRRRGGDHAHRVVLVHGTRGQRRRVDRDLVDRTLEEGRGRRAGPVAEVVPTDPPEAGQMLIRGGRAPDVPGVHGRKGFG